MNIPDNRTAAIRLLRALVAAGANTHEPMAKAWITAKALESASLEGDALLSALKYAGDQGWLDNSDSSHKGRTSLTVAGKTIGGSS